jgi:spermidine synthase
MRIPRKLIAEYFGEDAQLRETLLPNGFHGALLVIDSETGGELVRYLASLSEAGHLTQQSAMSLARPERLIFHYERLMSLAFLLTPRPERALLLGIGGGAMARYAAGAFPQTKLTLVERSDEVVEIAGRWFGLEGEVIRADAHAFLGRAEEAWDAILVDLYDAGGVVTPPKGFWERCAARLSQDGLIAVNWADFAGPDHGRAEAERLAALFPHALYVTPRRRGDNLVQFVSRAKLPDNLDEAMPGAAKLQRPRSTLSRCLVSRTWPA